MKRLHRKLVLHRETLVELGRSALLPVAGGYSPASCPQICTFSGGLHTCTTCDNQTCTTNFC